MTKQVIKVYIEVESPDKYEFLEDMLAEYFPKSYISSETVTKTLKELESEEDS